MQLEFVLRDLPGSVEIQVEPNVEPSVLGCPEAARGFPVCTATVTYSGRGYGAAFGWVQLVRSTDGTSEGRDFELDPFEPLGRLPHPFCFFGFAPTLFDAPSRPTRDSIQWTAHTFLCFLSEGTQHLQACAVLGFQWGFALEESAVMLFPPAAVSPAAWNDHLGLLRTSHPTWEFARGYRQD